MNRCTYILVCWCMLCLGGIPLSTAQTLPRYTAYVDPFIGTGFHGHVFMGASVPFGAVQLGPVNLSTGWDWCSGYHYSDTAITGFSHTHLSGTGIGDLGDISLMPVTGNVPLNNYYSLFSHRRETAAPGYYAVHLQRYNIQVALTATARVGLHQYQFPATADAKVIIDLQAGIGWDTPVETYIKQVNDTTLVGYRFSKGWAPDQRIWFAAVFSKPIAGVQLYDSIALQQGAQLKATKVKALVALAGKGGRVMVKVGISPVSIENALDNIAAELLHWNFNRVRAVADHAWNTELGKVAVSTPDTARLRSFYTALYHTMVAPAIFNDHNGDYRGTDQQVYRRQPFTNFTIFSLWDTYRAAHPLYTLFQSQRVNDMVRSMLAIYHQQGKLPIWHLAGNETNTMPGYSAVQVVADAYLKGFRGFDTSLAWEAVKATAMGNERGLSYVKRYGFIPADSMVESVATGLEYAIADAAIAQMADRMGKTADAALFHKRALYYRHYYDVQTGFMRGRVAEDKWRIPFSPFESRHMKDDFTEGNAWQYTWLVPHDVAGLMTLMGGRSAFLSKLDSLFIAKGDMGAEASDDITGLIGQYAHGNEPSHHIAYLYTYAGQPWKTAEKVRYILDSLYSDRPEGLCGNEDVGQLSAWYVLSALGFYQVNPANGVFVFGSPVIDRARLTPGNGRQLIITVKNNGPHHPYIQHVTRNGKVHTHTYLTYQELMAGGTIEIEMGPMPSATWGVNPADWPYSVKQ